MNLSISFNWPPGQDSVSVEMGGPNVNDREIEFRVGVVPKEHKDKIAWQGPEWVCGDENMERITFLARRGDKVIVERKKKGGDRPETRNDWDIDSEWPSQAYGAAMTVVPWYF